MNDVVLLSLAALVGIGFVLAYLACFAGKESSLCDAKAGEVFSFEYLQPLTGENKRHRVKVIEPVVRLTNTQIQNMNRQSSYRKHDPDFERTNHLVTCATGDGNVSFYQAWAKSQYAALVHTSTHLYIPAP